MTAPLQHRWATSLMDTYGTPPAALVSGSGAVVVDADGREYLDLLAGIAVNSLGHGHPGVTEAVTTQIGRLGHVSNLYIAQPPLELAEKLLASLGREGRVFLCNSGAEANEAAMKIARRTGRTKIVTAENGFHGRTMGALALTGQPDKRAPFEPVVPGVQYVPYGDVDALAAAVDDETAAVLLEPIQGEHGVIVPPPGYLAAAREITARHGALLMLDEVQTGIGRTGRMFAHQADGITPDVITLAKGLGGGLPIGATIALGPAADLLTPGQHGTTFGGNPVCSAAALAVLQTIESEDLLGHVAGLGKTIATEIEALGHPLIDHVRGAGLLLGIVLSAPIAKAAEPVARAHGYLLNAPAEDVLRIVPPLVLTEDQARRFVADLPAVLEAAQKETAR